ncbi:MAG: hypothetical protein WC761_03105 [Candidatus Paceibacterota bacterium]|jgi:tetratricopeptide (TPR) repeat protein
MKLSLSGVKMIFDREHRTYGIAALILVAALAIAFALSLNQRVPYNELQRNLAEGNLDQVIAYGEDYVRANPDDIKIKKLLATAYLEKADLLTERSMWVRKSRIILTRVPDVTNDAEIMRLLGYGLMLIKNYDAAKVSFQRTATLEPKNALVWANLGELSETRGNFSEATSLYDKAISFDSSNDAAILGKIRIALRFARFEEASNLANEQILKTENRRVKAELFDAIGVAALQRNRILEATDSFKLALGLNANLPQSLAGQAVILLKAIPPNLNRDVVAKTSQPFALATKAHKIDPTYPYALSALSDISLLRGNTSDAKKYATLTIASLPLSPLSQAEKRVLSEKYTPRASGTVAVKTSASTQQ